MPGADLKGFRRLCWMEVDMDGSVGGEMDAWREGWSVEGRKEDRLDHWVARVREITRGQF